LPARIAVTPRLREQIGRRDVLSPALFGETAIAQSNGSSIKEEDTYEALRDKGYSESKAARIANAQANDDMAPSKKGGKAPPYEEWSKAELYDQAQNVGIHGRSDMTKEELIDALRRGGHGDVQE